MNTVQFSALFLAFRNACVQFFACDAQRHPLVEAAPGESANNASEMLVVIRAIRRGRLDLSRGLFRYCSRRALLIGVGNLLQRRSAVGASHAFIAQLHIERARGFSSARSALPHPLVRELRVVKQSGAGEIVNHFINKLRLEFSLEQAFTQFRARARPLVKQPQGALSHGSQGLLVLAVEQTGARLVRV